MSITKRGVRAHSPGPWRIQREGGRIECVVDPSGNPVCWGYHEDFGALIMPIRLSNARLISAAPDLLETMKDIVEEASKTPMILPVDLSDSINVLGKQSIDRAEGKIR